MTTGTAGPVEIYDSSALPSPTVAAFANVWRRRRLLGVLTWRDLSLRYKRSVLGVWWTLLNPLLSTAVLWLIFSSIFKFQTGPVPYIVYMLSGVLLLTLFQEAVTGSANAIVHNSFLLSRVYAPAEIFGVAAAAAAAVTFVVGVMLLLATQLATGVGVPWTVVLTPIPVIAVLAMGTGLGLVVAAVAVRFSDALDVTRVGMTLLGFLTPTFYPIAIIPESFRPVIQANPLYSCLVIFRSLAYEGRLGTLPDYAVMTGVSVGMLLLGVFIFGRSWRSAVATI